MTICLATILLHSFTILSAQGIYSETLKQASFTRSQVVADNIGSGHAGFFTGLDLKKTSRGVQLTWRVSDWYTIRYFEIQRSTDNNQFVTIGFITASEKEAYRFTDNDAVEGPTYFRIKCVDRDDTVVYSSVISTGSEQSSAILIAYPMPAQSEITVQHALVTDRGLISVLTQEGHLVMAVAPGTGTMQTTLDLSYLKTGVYLLRFDTGNGKVETTRIVKQ